MKDTQAWCRKGFAEKAFLAIFRNWTDMAASWKLASYFPLSFDGKSPIHAL
jgi:hypothetical protein